ncbi:MAG: hydrogenase maturation nickel metallochaperone HypA [Candidatus Aminicenantales bacterium]
MHELSIIANLFEIMEEKAREKRAKKITGVTLKVGILSGVVPEFLHTAFELYKKGTQAEQAHLDIETVPLILECRNCGERMEKDEVILVCTGCGSRELKTLAGTELLLMKMELEL